MATKILIFLLLMGSNLFAQQLPADVEVTEDSDTIFWYNAHLKDIKGLSLIKPDSGTDFLRVSSSKYFLELSPASNKLFFYVHEMWDNVQTGESFIKYYDLRPEQVNEIKCLYGQLHIQQIPSDKFIENWKQGFDGITYVIETKTGKLFSFKHYWTPSSQDDFDESRRILEFTNTIDSIVDYSSKRNDFEKEIPFYGWTHDGSMMTVKVISNTKAFQKYRRMKRKEARRKKN